MGEIFSRFRGKTLFFEFKYRFIIATNWNEVSFLAYATFGMINELLKDKILGLVPNETCILQNK